MGKRFALVALLAAVIVIAMAPTALAKDPTHAANPYTFTESSPETSAIPVTTIAGLAGASAWTYQDSSDSSPKTQGSYKAFDLQSGIGTYTVNPHGGYSTSSNKCKTCHAVHRASGAFALMRVDNPDDACNYCHIGSHRHADSEAYFGGTNGIYSSNGHTIGSGKDIPDSSVWQWTENVTLTSADATALVPVRRYLTQQNKIMRYIVHGNRFIRVGPYNLRCAGCHQVHNATRQIWKPKWSGLGPSGGAASAGETMTLGYKLLRNSPSGGITVNSAHINSDGTLNSSPATTSRAYSRLNFTYYDPGRAGHIDGLSATTVDYRLTALERSYEPSTGTEVGTGAAIMGSNITGYTAIKYFAPTNIATEVATNSPVYETSLTWWCADCHNLNVAGKTLAPGFGTGRGGDGMLGDRSHATPGMYRAGTVAAAGTHCTACHNSDMPLDARAIFTGSDCGGCHITNQMFHYYKNQITVTGNTWAGRNDAYAHGVAQEERSDWPHAGPDWGRKLLNARDRRLVAITTNNNTTTNPSYPGHPGGADYDTQGSAVNFTTGDDMDKVCKTCHGGFKNREIGFDK